MQLIQNVLIIALTYLFAGRRRLPPLSAMWRRPNQVQVAAHLHLGVLARSWARDSAGVCLSMSRKGPAMGELMQMVEERARGLMADFDPYGASAPPHAPCAKLVERAVN